MNQDIVIVGAPRSGTNMLRDVLTEIPGVVTWPCDEINLMWRHGNRDVPSDELTRKMATPAVKRYLTGQFDRIRRLERGGVVVEKTCATSLRVEFTREVFPDAKYIFITRDGVDAAVSAMDRWHAPFDFRYTAKKARFVPTTDIPYYGRRFVKTALSRSRTSGSAQGQYAAAGQVTTWWGPKPHDYRELMEIHPLDEICAIQWQRCVHASLRGFMGMSDEQLIHVSYEDFVTDPSDEAQRVLDFLDLDGDVSAAVRNVSASSIGKGRRSLAPERTKRLDSIVQPAMERVRGG